MPTSADVRRGEAIAAVLTDLRDRLELSRATLRIDIPGGPPMPMTHELLADGVSTLAGRVVSAAGSPTVSRMVKTRRPVIVSDTARIASVDPAFADSGFEAMVRDYGGLSAFIAAPIFDGDRLAGILSLHVVGGPREWSAAEIDLVESAADRIRDDVLALGARPAGPTDLRSQ